MSRKWYLVLLSLCVPVVWWLFPRNDARTVQLTPTEGISQQLAEARKRAISAVAYELTLSIPSVLGDPVRGRETIRVRMEENAPIVVDFQQPAASVTSLSVNGRQIPIQWDAGHLVIPREAAGRGTETIAIDFVAGNDALNRSEDFLYSLFVPARASRTFPCFDQPDLKGSMALSLEIPSEWVAVANAPEAGRKTSGQRTTITFLPTKALPTYLFGFAAGKFTVERGERNGRTFQLYHRETDKEKVAANRDAMFDLHQQALDWLEEYTGRKYPFEKLDFVLLPAFQFAGMEHAGAIFYSAPAMFLDKTATQDQLLARASTIAHETAHMWFGDLVTMKWFDDVWLKEVFANFMAGKIVNPSFPEINHELRFLLQHYPSAYEVDRTRGANPIRQRLDNLSNAGSLYGAIIYDKAPIVMRQLETIVGEDSFRAGIREYLDKYAFENATWADLIQILDRRTDEDLQAWSRAWVDEPGRPTISTELTLDGDKVTHLGFRQTDPLGRSMVWNQRLQVALGYEGGARITTLKMNAEEVELPNSQGLPRPRFVLANGEGVGYGLFKLDAHSRQFFLEHLPDVGDAVTRATAWLTLWDDMLEGGVRPGDLLELMLRALPQEREEQNVQRVLGYMTRTYWTFLNDAERLTAAPRVEQAVRSGMTQAATTSLKSAYFTTFRRVVLTPVGVDFLDRVWRKKESIPGLTFAETDYIAMAQELALRRPQSADAVLRDQLAQISNPDRKARFTFVMPSLSPEETVRDQFFSSLSNVENRRREPWVLDALSFLNHPLRRSHAIRYVEPSLALLADVQRTGDIFFPMRWTQSVLDGHNSPAAAEIVRTFLASRKDYAPRLRQIIEQSSDTLIRASTIVR